MRLIASIALFFAFSTLCFAEQVRQVIHQEEDGSLRYDADESGNVIPDFSSAGYMGGGVALPRVDAKVRLSPSGEDDTRRLQAAIDWVSALPLDKRGIRGAVELAPGEFQVSGQLKIRASGVVLRGFTGNDRSTILRATGEGRRDLIAVGKSAAPVLEEKSREVQGDYLPVGSKELKVSDASGISVGDSIRITRPGSKEWARDLGMDKAPARTPFNWRGETVILHWDRVVVGKRGNTLELDAPFTTALDAKYGRSYVQKFISSDAITMVGIESLQCVSDFNTENPKDENHSWVAVSLNGAVDSWVSDVSAKHFAMSSVRVGEDCRRVTVQDCSYLDPVSEIGGYRRQSFNTYGQQTLFLRCFSEEAIDDFTVGYLAGGPNVFLHCSASVSRGTSGSIGHWASGILFDNVHIDGGAIALDNREIWNQGVGWAAANSVIYQSSAADIITRRPPTANNWAMGVWALFHGDGTWIQTSEFANPESLYIAQLGDRLGGNAEESLKKRLYISNRMAVPELEQVLPEIPEVQPTPKKSMKLVGGQLQAEGLPLIGQDRNITWWRGRLLPTRSDQFGYSITRFTPGRSGSGLTDDLDEMTDQMSERGDVALRHHYGLWYDRRRDDHQMTRRSSGDVWPPFYEQAFSRSGVGSAWDGLSKYDLFKYNSWYFERLDSFAELAEEKGLVLVNEMFFQHNIIESGAHWVDNPWRPTNAIQKTGFPEPPPFHGDTIRMADEWYDISKPILRDVARAYIRKCLDNLAEDPNVIHTVGAEYTGPLHFMRFWLDTVSEWQQETGRDPIIGLSCTKDVQDAILSDPVRSKIVDVIDFQYWWYTDDALYAPEGGVSLAPRQHERKWKGGRPSGQSLARMVLEYRLKYPEKAIITPLAIKDVWAYIIAGGSLAPLPKRTDARLLQLLAESRPVESGNDSVWVMRSDAGDLLVRSLDGAALDNVLLDPKNEYEFFQIDSGTGKADSIGIYKSQNKKLKTAMASNGLYWLHRR